MKINRKLMALFMSLALVGVGSSLDQTIEEVNAAGITLNGAGNRDTRGSSYWPTTNLREWLNSASSTVRYTDNPPSSKHLGDNAYDKEPGFLTSFTTAERNAIVVTRRRVPISGADANQLNAPGGVRPYGNGSLESPYMNYGLPGLMRDYKNYNHVKINDKVFVASPYEIFLYLQQRGYSLVREPSEALKSKGYAEVDDYWMSGGESYNGRETGNSTKADGTRAINNGVAPYISKGVVPMLHVDGNYRFSNGQLAKNVAMGTVVTFGRHLGEPIQWRVVNRTNGHALLISEKIIDMKSLDAPGDRASQTSDHINFSSPKADISEYAFFAPKNGDAKIPDLAIVNDAEMKKRQNSGFTLNFRASDAHGIEKIILPNGNVVKSTTFSYSFPRNDTYNFVVVDKSGNHRYYVLPIGNINVPYSMKATPSTTDWTKDNVTVDIRATNEGVGSSRASLTQSSRDAYLSDGWPDYSTFIGKRIRIRGSVEYVGSKMSDINNRRVVVGFRYNYTEFDGNEWNKKGTWHQAISWPLREVRDKKKINFDVTTTVPDNFFEQIRPWLSINMTSNNNGAHTVKWTNISFELVDDNDYKITKIILPNGSTVNRANYVDTLTSAGTYTYTAVDARGMRVSDTVVAKIDKAKPTITQRSTHSAWTNNAQQTIKVKATDSQSGVSRVRLPNGTFITNASQLNGDLSYTVDKNGSYTFTAYDRMGHSQSVTVNVSNFDHTAPTVTHSGNPTSWTKNNVSLTVNASDSQSGVKRIQTPDGKWTNGSRVNYTVTSNGTYRFIAEDNTGNRRTHDVVVDKIDKTLPNGTITGNPTSWTNQNATLTFTATDTGSGVKRVRQSGGTWVNGNKTTRTVSANGTYSFEVEDNVGNVRTVSVTVNRIDKTAPGGTISGNPTAWTKSNVTLNFNATDSGGSGVRRVRQAGGTWVSGTTTSRTVSSNGTYSFEVEDHAGNTKTISVTVNRIDKTLPNGTITGNPTSWTNKNVDLTFTAKDSGGAGVKRVRQSGGSWVNGNRTTRTVTANGTYSFEVEDNAGNTRTVSVTVNRIDKSLPSGTISGNPTSWTNKNVVLHFSTTDTGGSGVRRVQRPDGTWVNGSSTSYTVSTNGTYKFVVEDHAGNTKDVSVVVNRIDKSTPTLTISNNPSAWVGTDVTLSIKASDTGGSGVKHIVLPNGTVINGSQTSFTIAQNGSFTFKVVDVAGNESSQTISVSRIDKTNPTGNVTPNTTNWTNKNVTLTVTASDSQSGIKEIIKPDGTKSTSATTTYIVERNGTYTFTIVDRANNKITKTFKVSNIDKEVPSEATLEISK